MDIEKAKKLIMPAKVISFDLYDTLIHRTVERPERVFDLMEKICKERYGRIAMSFSYDRKVAERKARRRAIQSGKEDVTLEEIYKELPYDFTTKQSIMDMEKQVEIDVCCADLEHISLLQFCATHNKIIIITTDMYLPRDTIYEILRKIGVLDNCIKVYISSEIGMTKGSGNIYPYIAGDLNVSTDQILHFGDNYQSDYIMAIQGGFQAFWLRDENKKTTYFNDSKKIEEEHLRQFILRHHAEDEDLVGYNLGFGLVGPWCYGFCKWLHEESFKNQFDCLAFVAREGWFLQQIYLSLYPEDFKKCKYFKINKNTLRLPLLYLDNSVNNFIKLIPYRKAYQIKQILNYMLIDPDSSKTHKLLKKYGYTEESNICRAEFQSKSFLEFYTDLYNLQKQVIEEQYILLEEYMAEYKGKIALINNSLEASVQNYLELIEKRNMYSERSYWGIHFIITKKGMPKIQNRCSVYFDKNTSQFSKRVFYRNCLVLEHLLFESSGTALYFKRNCEKAVEVVCEPFIEEKQNSELLDKIQGGALDFVAGYLKHISLTLSNRYILNALKNFLLNPQYADAVQIAAIVDKESTGTHTLAPKMTDRNIKKVYRTFHNYDITKWRNGFLKINFNNELIMKLYNIYLKLEMIKRKIV